MPAGVTDTPGGIPLKLLILELGLCEPKNEVSLISLISVCLNAIADADLKVLFVKVVEDIILFKLRGVKIDISACLVSISLFKKRLDHSDKFGNALGCGLGDRGLGDMKLFAIGKECVGVELSDLKHRLVLTARALKHLILARVTVTGEMSYVGDIHNARYVVADIAKIFFKNVLHSIGTKVSYMSVMINGRTAGIHRYLTRLTRYEFLSRSGC